MIEVLTELVAIGLVWTAILIGCAVLVALFPPWNSSHHHSRRSDRRHRHNGHHPGNHRPDPRP